MRISRFPNIVDDVTVRLIAAVVLVLGVVALAAQQWWLYAVLAVGLRAARRAGGPSASPVAIAGQPLDPPAGRGRAALHRRTAQALRRGHRRRVDRGRHRPVAGRHDRAGGRSSAS